MVGCHPPELTEDKLLEHSGALDRAGCLSLSRCLCTAGVPCPQGLQALPAQQSLTGLSMGSKAALFPACASGHTALLRVA